MSDPFRRNAPSIHIGITPPGDSNRYRLPDRINGIERLMEKAMPLLLIRTDPRIECTCDKVEGSADPNCNLCLGTGKKIQALDRFRGYISLGRKSINPSPLTPMGYEDSGASYIYTGKWVYPSMGDIVLEVGWNRPNSEVIGRGMPTSIDKVHMIREVMYPGFSQIEYIMMAAVPSDTRINFMEDALLFGKADLPVITDVTQPY